MKKQSTHKTGNLIGLCLLTAILAGCGGASSKADQAMSTDSYAVDDNYYMAEYAAEDANIWEEEYPGESQAASTGEDVTVESTARKLIKTVDMGVETKDFDGLLSAINEKVDALGGYIENSYTYNGSSYGYDTERRYADLSIRIPQDRLEQFIGDVQGISNVTNCTRGVRDVTLTYVDLESHRNALQAEQKRLMELMDQAETIEDLITIENRLSEVRYQIESMESQLRSYDNQVDYSTVDISISEVKELTPVDKESVGERIARGFKNSLEGVGRGLVNFAVSFIIALPYLLVWGIVLALCVWIPVHFIRRSRKKKLAGAQPVNEKKDK